MTAINWDDGRLISLNPGDTATSQKLNQNQLYALVLYNVAQNDTGANLLVVWSNSQPPTNVSVPGTTAKQGLASLVFVNGSDTTTISLSFPANQPGAQVKAYIASVKMPVNTAGINNAEIPFDGSPHPFKEFTRYYGVPANHWYQGQIQSNINQFISVQFTSQSAIVNVVNKVSDPALNIYSVGSASKQYTINWTANQNLTWNLQGNGGQLVWVNADSIQNAQSATISIQSLAGLYEVFDE